MLAGSRPNPSPLNGDELTCSLCPREVIVKLLAFTFAMIVFPIGSYYVTVNTIFKGLPRPPPHPPMETGPGC